jgi:FkbM family methyltransferase
MSWTGRIRQLYRYRRNLRKIRAKSPRREKYLEKQCEFYSQFIKKGDLCFDVGANIGDKAEIFLELGAKVVAVEPQESCWRIIRRRFNNNPDMFIEPIVLAEADGEKILHVDKSPTISSISEDWIKTVKESGRFSDSHKWSYKVRVKSSTLDKLISKYGTPVFCKIDVEGAELEVLKGLSRPIKYISMEFISERLENAIACVEHLHHIGDVVFNYYFGESLIFELDKWVGCDDFVKHLESMDKKVENYGDIYCSFSL